MVNVRRTPVLPAAVTWTIRGIPGKGRQRSSMLTYREAELTSEPATICIIDDDPVILKTMGRILEARGHRVSLFHAGTSAAVDIPDIGPDCVITDINMVGLDGLALIRDLRKHDQMKNTKFAVVSANTDDNTKLSAESIGVGLFIEKPFELESFIEKVEAFLLDA